MINGELPCDAQSESVWQRSLTGEQIPTPIRPHVRSKLKNIISLGLI